jgi:hypothetical protein
MGIGVVVGTDVVVGPDVVVSADILLPDVGEDVLLSDGLITFCVVI